MPSYDFRRPRLFVDAPLRVGEVLALDARQSHYMLRVLRLVDSDTVLVFNGRDGEWLGRIAQRAKRPAQVALLQQTRGQPIPGDLHYLFAPLKHARLDYLVQKAVEMGVSNLQPVITGYTQIARVNLARMRANAIEAAEQCGVLNLPAIAEPLPFAQMAEGLARERLLIFCDEDAEVADPVAALAAICAGDQAGASLALLTGPEGGFAPAERAALLALPRVVRIALGPRILRADTAAVAALALVQAVLGDWK